MTDAATSQAQEPSMEEILASIRRIISEDGDAKPGEAKAAEAPKAEPPAEPAKAEAPKPEPPKPAPPPPAPPPPPAAVEEDVLELTEVAPEPPPPAAPPPAAALDDALLSAASAGAAAAAFASLSKGDEAPPARTVLIGDGARTLEDMVRELLRPMLKAWLDENLPGMVERMVRAEIERVARRG